MQQTRRERHTRERNKRGGRLSAIVFISTFALVLTVGIYYIWYVNWQLDEANNQSIDSPDSIIESDMQAELPAPVNELPVKESNPPAENPSAEKEAERIVSLAFVGDIMMGARIDTLLRKEGFDYPYRDVNQYLSEVDAAIGNLENPITDRGEPYDKSFVFRMSPEAVPALQQSGLSVLNLANNHTLDYGLVGLRDTIQYLNEAQIGHMGAGENDEEAFRPYIFEKNGIVIHCLGFTNVVPDTSWKADKKNAGLAEMYNYTRAVAAIEKSQSEADLVIVMVHWGTERKDTPEPYMIDKAHRFIDAGADLIVGSHPHVLQGIESYKGKWITYSLGKFIFTVNPNSPNRDSAILRADCGVKGDCQLKVIPLQTGIGRPYPAEEDEATAILDQLNRLSVGAQVLSNGEVIALSTP